MVTTFIRHSPDGGSLVTAAVKSYSFTAVVLCAFSFAQALAISSGANRFVENLLVDMVVFPQSISDALLIQVVELLLFGKCTAPVTRLHRVDDRAASDDRVADKCKAGVGRNFEGIAHGHRAFAQRQSHKGEAVNGVDVALVDELSDKTADFLDDCYIFFHCL